MLEATQTETGLGRRGFLKVGAAAAGALLIGFPLRPAKAEAGIFAPERSSASPPPATSR